MRSHIRASRRHSWKLSKYLGTSAVRTAITTFVAINVPPSFFSLSLSLPLRLSVSRSLCLSLCLSACLASYLAVSGCPSLSVCLCVSVCLCLSLSVCSPCLTCGIVPRVRQTAKGFKGPCSDIRHQLSNLMDRQRAEAGHIVPGSARQHSAASCQNRRTPQ